MKKAHGNTGNKNAVKAEDESKTSRLHIACTPDDKSKWVKEAKPSKLSDWVTKTLNKASE